MVSRRLSPLLFGCTLVAAAVAAAETEVPARRLARHIAVVVLDDVGVDQLSCYGRGSDFAATPHICGLAQGGFLFRNAWSNPTCSPTRATIQTGRYSFRTGVTYAGLPLAAEERTLAEVFADPANRHLGFATAAIGKWHLSGGNFHDPPSCASPADPREQGYDHAAGTASNIGDYFRWCRTVDGTTGVCTAGGPVPECAERPYATTVNVDDALAWVKDRRGPWFLWLAFNAPHRPFHVPPAQCPAGPCHRVELPERLKPGDFCPPEARRACYKAMLETLDTEIGRLLASLPGDTAVLLLGDNGTPDAVVRPPFDPERAKFTVYEGGIHIPLIARLPTLGSRAAEVDALVNTTDLFATVLELAGAAVPAGIVHDSVSWLPLLRGEGAGRTWIFSESLAGTDRQRAVRGERFKLIRRRGSRFEKVELYDLRLDPFEKKDLYRNGEQALSPEHQRAFEDLQAVFDLLDGRPPPREEVPQR